MCVVQFIQMVCAAKWMCVCGFGNGVCGCVGVCNGVCSGNYTTWETGNQIQVENRGLDRISSRWRIEVLTELVPGAQSSS